MSYQVLARKWRPRTFQEVVGQEHILRMLTNALNNQRLHHAYLFTGTRGVGKTTIARILAKSLNCEMGITSIPCEKCMTCHAINTGKCLDLIEVDAASRTKVEDTRELLENVQYTPSHARFKIYLIDEVHMLSNHSFNALLKTLEEPPSYIKFILATTDPKRLPITILSRCLQFNLCHVSIEKISQHLAHICTAENIPFEVGALNLLADAAAGSVRDSLSLLDQAIAFCHENITTADTRLMLGSIDHTFIYQLLDAIAIQNGTELLNEIANLASMGPDFNQVLEDLLSILHHISVAQLIAKDNTYSEQIVKFAKLFSKEDIQLYYQIALIGRRDLSFAPNPRIGFEMIFLRMLAFQPYKAVNQISKNEKPAEQPESVNETIQIAKEPVQNWNDIIKQLKLSGMSLALATHCDLSDYSENKMILSLSKKHESLLNKKWVERIEHALIQYLNKPVQLEIKITDEALNTPAEMQAQKKAELKAMATSAIQNNTHVQKIIDVFDATIDLNSITAT